jgi:hypothetical protein
MPNLNPEQPPRDDQSRNDARQHRHSSKREDQQLERESEPRPSQDVDPDSAESEIDRDDSVEDR